MSRPQSILHKTPGVILLGLIVYIFCLIFKNPAQPRLPLAEFGAEKAGNLLRSIKNRPLLYPSQTEKINSYLKSFNSRAMEGFQSIVSSPNSRSTHRRGFPTYRFKHKPVKGWFTNQPGQELVWTTPPCKDKKSTTLVFSGSLGPGEGKTEIFLNNKSILVIETGENFHREEWVNGPYKLRFFPLRRTNIVSLFESGIFCLTVPGSEVIPGKSLQVKARYKEGRKQFFAFLIFGFRDTYQILKQTENGVSF